MSLVFTDHVRSLEPRREQLHSDDFAAVWKKLGDALTSEMKKRSVWSVPPRRLGIYGWNRWIEPGALEDLQVDCYTFVFLRRLKGLKALLDVQENVEGVVFRSIRNFLYERQRKHDPLGRQVFEVLRAATRRAISSGTLHVLEGDPRVGNQTVLGFAPDLEPGQARQGPGDQLQGLDGDLLPELVTAKGAAREEVVEELCGRLARLRSQGVEVFRFKDVIDTLKRDVRARWDSVWRHSAGETAFEDVDQEVATIVRLVRPKAGFEERESFEELVACLTEALAGLEETENTRAYLHKLLVFLRSATADSEPDKLPSRRRIAELLGIPRYRLPGLHAILGHQVELCQEVLSGRRRDLEFVGNRPVSGRSAEAREEGWP